MNTKQIETKYRCKFREAKPETPLNIKQIGQQLAKMIPKLKVSKDFALKRKPKFLRMLKHRQPKRRATISPLASSTPLQLSQTELSISFMSDPLPVPVFNAPRTLQLRLQRCNHMPEFIQAIKRFGGSSQWNHTLFEPGENSERNIVLEPISIDSLSDSHEGEVSAMIENGSDSNDQNNSAISTIDSLGSSSMTSDLNGSSLPSSSTPQQLSENGTNDNRNDGQSMASNDAHVLQALNKELEAKLTEANEEIKALKETLKQIGAMVKTQGTDS